MLLPRRLVALLGAAALFAGFLQSPALASIAPTVNTLTLINARTQKALRTLSSSSTNTIALGTDGEALNVRADVSSSVHSVVFFLDGKAIRTESSAPFAFAADNSGKFYAWRPPTGSHTLKAVPYSEKGAKGTAGAAKQVTLKVVSGTSSTSSSTSTSSGSTSSGSTSSSSTSSSSTSSDSKSLISGLSELLFSATGALKLSTYGLLALSYDKATMELRLGPAFVDLSPNAADNRPTLYKPTSKSYSGGYIRVNPYQLGKPSPDNDYWSDSGQVGYVPDSSSNPGLDRIQTFAYYDHVFAISPRLDYASGTPRPDPQTRLSSYRTLFGEKPEYPIAMVRNYGMQQNEALVLYRDGNLGVAGTQTSRTSSEGPYPGFVFPEYKVPTAIAITTENEFALVTIWDTSAHKGQLAVIALEGKFLPFHTWPYMALPNQGSWSAFKLLGYVDLPMKTPSAVAAASNGWWSGPSQTGGLVMSQIDLSKDGYRKNVYSGNWSGMVATGGYAIVASKYENLVALVNLKPLFHYIRESYLSSAASYKATLAARSKGAFPQTFSARPAIKPTVVWHASVASPNAVLAGLRLNRWTKDYFKAYAAAEDGNIYIIDTSPLMKRHSWEKLGSLRIAGKFDVGRNPVGMCFARRGESSTLPLLPKASDGSQTKPDPLNNLFYIAVRGDRKVVAAVTYGGQGAVYRTIRDKRMDDPVAVSTAVRGPIVSVADFRGKKVLSFRVGRITDARNGKTYGCGADGGAPFEFAGELVIPGHPFLLNSTNVN